MLPDPKRKMRMLFAAGAASVVAIGLFLALSRKPVEPERAASMAWPSGGLERPAVPAAAPAPVASSLTPPTGSADVSDLDRVLDTLKDIQAEPEAQKIAKQIAEHPQVKPRLDEFQKDQQGPAPKDSLLKVMTDLGQNDAFHQLVARFAQEPGFASLAKALDRLPETRPFIRQELARLTGGAPGGRAAQSAIMSGHRLGAVRPSVGARGSGGTYGTAGALAGGGGVSGGHGAEEIGAPGQLAGQPAIDGSANSKGGTTNAANNAAQDDAHEVGTQMSSSGDSSCKDGSADCEQMKWLCRQPRFKGFCDGDKIKPQFLALLPYIKAGKGIWGGCFEMSIYPQCAAACRASSGCVAEDAWTSCMEFNGSAPTCLQQCRAKSLCANDPGYTAAVAQYCNVPASALPSYCPPGSGIPGTTGNCAGAPPRITCADGSAKTATCVNGSWSTPNCSSNGETCSNGCPNYPDCAGWEKCQADGRLFIYNCFGRVTQCIAAGTPVRVPDGLRAIEDLKEGDALVSVDERSGEPVTVHVVRRLLHHDTETLDFQFGGKHLLLTGVHPVYDPDKHEYRPASTFKVGDRLALAENGNWGVARLTAIGPGPRLDVLDISVDGTLHNFVAGGVLVHNKGTCP